MFVKIIRTFEQNGNPELIAPMKAYMKGRFEFFGIKSPQRAEISKSLFADCKKLERKETLDLVKKLWKRPERELHYFTQEMMLKNLKKKWEQDDIEFLQWMAENNSWWDTIDFIAPKLMMTYFEKFPKIRKKKIDEWIASENIWLIRCAILCQLKTKQKTDFDLLFNVILRVNKTKEFFVDKAIGWVLRENAKYHEKIILDFAEKHRKDLSNLSIKEALKHFPERM